jgi:Na+/H+-dicarboxylate symporter
MLLIKSIMYLAPVGVFALMAYLLATTGLDILYTLLKLILVLILGLVFWIYGVLGLVIIFFTKVKYIDFIKKIIPLQLVAFSTSSSLASIPTNMSVCENLKVNQNVYRFTLPIGATIHMNGSALFYCVVTIFCANFFNIDLSFTTYLIMAVVAMLGSIATPGVPGLSLTVVMVLGVAGVPLAALPLIIAVDRVLDMFITVANAVGDTVATTFVDNRLN